MASMYEWGVIQFLDLYICLVLYFDIANRTLGNVVVGKYVV